MDLYARIRRDFRVGEAWWPPCWSTVSFLPFVVVYFLHMTLLPLCLGLVVDLAAVCDLDDEDEDLVVVNICEDSVIADPVTPEFFVDELFTEPARIIQLGELLLKKITDPFRDGRVEFPDLFRCFRGESDRVAHAGQTTSARSIASSLD